MTDKTILAQKNWRQEKRAARKSLSSVDKHNKSRQIVQRLLATEYYQQAEHIGAYLCMPEEVNVQDIIDAAWADGKKVYLPVVLAWGEPLQFAPFTPDTVLVKDCLAIDIPDIDSSQYVCAERLDMVVTPLVAFDEQCNRIGMGGGFYDRTFAFKNNAHSSPVLLGVAFDIQRVTSTIIVNEWDIRPDMIVSETTIYSQMMYSNSLSDTNPEK